MVTFIQSLRNADQKDKIILKEGEEVIKVDLMASAVSFFYEKLRTFVDYNEEHLLRKNAIFRILKRKIIEGAIDVSDQSKIAENLIKEMISARYLPNNEVPRSLIATVQTVIEKYQVLFEEIKQRHGLSKALKSYNFIMGLAACELEEIIVPSNKEKVWLRFMLDACLKNIEVVSKKLTDEQKEMQMYLAVERTLFKADRQMLEYSLLRMFYPSWQKSYRQIVEHLAKKIFEIKDEFGYHLTSKIANRLVKACRKYATMTNILKVVVEENFHDAENLIANPEKLKEKITKVCDEKYSKIRRKLTTSIFRSIIYVLITKMTLALILEVPIEMAIEGTFNSFALGVNILMPPFLMFLIGISIKKPTTENTQAIVAGIEGILYDQKIQKTYVKPKLKRSWWVQSVFNGFYAVAFILPFFLVLLFLRYLGFSIISIIIFSMFLSIVTFFGVRIRNIASELVVEKKKEHLIGEIFEFLTLPLIQFGRWMSTEFSRINIFVFVMDFIIEAPLKMILEAFSNWQDFIKEKKEELY